MGSQCNCRPNAVFRFYPKGNTVSQIVELESHSNCIVTQEKFNEVSDVIILHRQDGNGVHLVELSWPKNVLLLIQDTRLSNILHIAKLIVVLEFHSSCIVILERFREVLNVIILLQMDGNGVHLVELLWPKSVLLHTKDTMSNNILHIVKLIEEGVCHLNCVVLAELTKRVCNVSINHHPDMLGQPLEVFFKDVFVHLG